MESFKNSNFVTKFCKITGTCKSCRTCTNNCNLNTIRFRFNSIIIAVSHMVVSYESFKTTDRNRFALDTTDTFSFTLIFLWTNTSANSRKTISACDNLVSFFKFSCSNLSNKLRYTYTYRTTTHTRFVLTVNTTSCFFHSHFFSITQSNFFKILITYVRILLRHWNLC